MQKISSTPLVSIVTGLLLIIYVASTASCTSQSLQELITVADAREQKAEFVDIGKRGDSLGDLLVFDQPLLSETGETLGNNSGTCIRTRIAHSFQCQWTLTFDNGSIQVAGREFDQGESAITIVGGTGAYAGIRGEMISTNNNDGTFTQTLRYWLR